MAKEMYYDRLAAAVIEFCKSTNYLFYYALDAVKITTDYNDNMVAYYRGATDIDGSIVKIDVHHTADGLVKRGFPGFVNGVEVGTGAPVKGNALELDGRFVSALDLLVTDIVKASTGLGIPIAALIFDASENSCVFEKIVKQQNGEYVLTFKKVQGDYSSY